MGKFVNNKPQEWQEFQADLSRTSLVCQCFSVLGTKRKVFISAIGWLEHHLLSRIFRVH